ncbi:zinc-dependent metalloprotease [Kitasatospora sp. NPDC059747]|uniref:zinc-dependent metalloprotease n=1 Tax=Kitasatospora sp. NPDC059747 TaxID=3346930 RepID=UPI00365ED6DA
MIEIEIVVEQQAGGAWDALAEAARVLTGELAGPVEETTGLDLGPGVRLALVDPDAFAQRREAYVRRVCETVLAGEALAAVADPAKREKAEAALRKGPASADSDRRISCVPSGRVVQDEEGRWVLLLAPALLAGAPQRAPLRAVLAHLLTHQAQIRAGGPRPGADAVEALLLHRTSGGTREDDPVLGALWEGHARWATRRLLARDQAGERKTARAARLLSRLPGVRAESDTHEKAVRFVRTLVEAGGTETVNRIWTDRSLVPTRRELTSPARWLARTGLGPAEGGPPEG